jgi:hypothetical protein
VFRGGLVGGWTAWVWVGGWLWHRSGESNSVEDVWGHDGSPWLVEAVSVGGTVGGSIVMTCSVREGVKGARS